MIKVKDGYAKLIGTTYSGSADRLLLSNGRDKAVSDFAASSHKHSASDITSGTLSVARGGTGATSFTSGAALIGNGTGAVSTRSITSSATKDSTSLITSGGVYSALAGKMNASITSIELNTSGGLKSYGGFIDFHFHDSNGTPLNASGEVTSDGKTPDYTSRIIEDALGQLSVNGTKFKNGLVTSTKFKGSFEGDLTGNASTATTATTASSCTGNSATASALTSLTASDTASSSATKRKIWMCYADGTTGRPALSDNLSFQTSTNTLFSTNFNGNLTGNVTGNLTGNVTGNVSGSSGSCTGNSATATKAALAEKLQASSNTITSTANDTTAKWGALHNTVHFYATKDQLTDQPSQYGLVINFNNSGPEVHQLWLTQASGDAYHRGGNSSGWSGTWRKFLDSSNYTSYINTTNFPGLNSVGDITGVTAGNGLTGGATSGNATLNVGAGTGITVNADDIAVKYGTTAGTACQGNDSRLSNKRSNPNSIKFKNTAGTEKSYDGSSALDLTGGINYAARSGSAAKISNYYASRPTSIAPGISGDGSMFHFKCTSSVTDTTTDPGDSHILHFNWDNNGGYDFQIACLTSSSTMKIRGMSSKSWLDWATVLTSSNYTSYVKEANFPGINKTGTVTSVATGTGLTGGTITSSGTISINSTYQTYISNGNTAYRWGNHASAKYMKAVGRHSGSMNLNKVDSTMSVITEIRPSEITTTNLPSDYGTSYGCLISARDGNSTYGHGKMQILGCDKKFWMRATQGAGEENDGTWCRLALTSDLPTKTSQLTNDSGYITSYVDTAAGKTFKTLSSKSHSGWTNNATDDKILPTMSFIAYWNGAYNSGNNSNLTYCANGTILGSNNYTSYVNTTNFPGLNKTGTVTKVSTGKGLTGGNITTTGTIKCNLNSETSLGTLGTTSKLYAIGVDANGKLCVKVPWVQGLASESDPIFSASAAAGITATDIANWNGKTANTGTVTKVSTGTGLTGGNITSTGTISINSTYQTYISNGNTAYGWGNHANAGYIKSTSILKGWSDTRSVATKPNDYNGAFKVIGIKSAGTTLGLTSTQAGSYATIIGWRGWSDSSGGYAWEIASTDKNRLYVRSGSTTSWNNGWQAIAYTSDIPNPANYYWANIKVSASSSTSTQPTFNTCYTSNWFRSTGDTGWYNASYDGGWYMSDSTWVRSYNSKGVVAGGYYHTSYASSAYALTSDGGAAHIGSMSVNYANSAGNASYVTYTSRQGKGSGVAQFAQYSGATDNPTNDWYSHIIMNHANSAGYYTEIATCFHSDSVYFRKQASGTTSAWKKFAWTSDIPSVGNGTVTINQAGASKGSFTLNQSTAATINLTDTNYYHTPSYSSGLSIASGTGVNAMYVPNAGASQSGVVSTGAQTFAGEKTFSSIRLRSTSTTNYGGYLYFGNGSNSYITEPSDDAMTIYSSKGVTISTSNSTTGTINLKSALSNRTSASTSYPGVVCDGMYLKSALYHIGSVYKLQSSTAISVSYGYGISGVTITSSKPREGKCTITVTNNSGFSIYVHTPHLVSLFTDSGGGSCFEHGFAYIQTGVTFPKSVSSGSTLSFSVIYGYMHTQRSWNTNDFTKSNDVGGFNCGVYVSRYV